MRFDCSSAHYSAAERASKLHASLMVFLPENKLTVFSLSFSRPKMISKTTPGKCCRNMKRTFETGLNLNFDEEFKRLICKVGEPDLPSTVFLPGLACS